ncbi:thioredoxin family protein [Candidatus Peregrinibacteria bacterium]|nr:thioredoxin family protein [Candidatus Peregrinibacteria bacterium]
MKYLLLSIGSALLLSACNTPSTEVAVLNETPKNSESDHSSEWTEEEMAAMEEEMEEGETHANLEDAQYVAFSDSLYKDLLGKEPFAIFFHASWCPTCQGLEKDINAELSSFPKGVKILKANFDTETELKYKYNIGAQSTFVIVDKDGEYVKTLVAPSNKELTSTLTALL